jgi:hypothetical protein
LPTLSFDPYGAIDVPSFGATSVRVTGWAGDPEAAGPIDVSVSVDGAVAGRASAGLPRAGNGNRGFDVTVPASPASAQICVTAVNVGRGTDTKLGCAAFPYSTDLNLNDPCGAVTQPVLASKWRLPPPFLPPTFQNVQEQTTSSAGRIGFTSGPASPGLSVGVSLSDGVMLGPLFRSNPMSSLPAGSPANPSGRLNLAVQCTRPFTGASLNTVTSGLTAATGVKVTSAGLTPGWGTLTLTVDGTANIFGFSSVEPFRYVLTFTVTPSTNMNNPAQTVVVARIVPGLLTFTGSSGWFLNSAVAPNMEPGMTAVLPGLLETAINRQIVDDVTSAMGGLPAGATISVPQLTVMPVFSTVTTSVGWFG